MVGFADRHPPSNRFSHRKMAKPTSSQSFYRLCSRCHLNDDVTTSICCRHHNDDYRQGSSAKLDLRTSLALQGMNSIALIFVAVLVRCCPCMHHRSYVVCSYIYDTYPPPFLSVTRHTPNIMFPVLLVFISHSEHLHSYTIFSRSSKLTYYRLNLPHRH
jgi:hypothetical protein